MSEIQFFDLKKRGTIIVSSPRSGSHYLQNVVSYQLERQQIPHVTHDQLNNKNIYQDMDTSGGKYRIYIANDTLSINHLMQQENYINNWYVVRMTRQDIDNWAVSNYFMFQQQSFGVLSWDQATFKHNSTERSIYEEHFDTVEKPIYPLSELLGCLSCREKSYEISYNLSIDYNDLKNLVGVHPPWTPNDYPDIVLERDFKNGIELKKILEVYQSIEQLQQSF
jgi:hypothetical protein